MLCANLLLLGLSLVMLTGCLKDPGDDPRPVDPEGRVLVMYDNIGSWFRDDVAEAARAVAAGALKKENQRVIVFERRNSGSVVYELVQDGNSYREKMVKEYANGVNNTLSVEVMRSVVADIRDYAPAAHYGFAFGSHGLGWVPKSIWGSVPYGRRAPADNPFGEFMEPRENPTTRFFRSQWGENMDVAEFIDALDEWDWEFIILDDCFMAGVETLYQMRGLADYIIASPTEIISHGFPYDRVVSRLFADWENDIEVALTAVSQAFVDWYEEQYNDARSATISLVDTSQLDALAAAIGLLNLNVNELTSVEGLQYYEGLSRPAHLFYDIDDYLSRIRGTTMPTEYNGFVAALDRAVVWAGHTDEFYSGYPAPLGQMIPVNHFSGVAVFIPWSATAVYVPAYQETEWYRTVYQ